METEANIKGRRRGCRSGFGGGDRQGSMFVGLVLVVLGVGLLLQNFGILRVRNVLSFWPVFPILWGVHVLTRSRSMFSYLVGGLAIGLGGLKLLDNLDIIDVGAKFYAPLVLIGIGVAFLVRNLGGTTAGDERMFGVEGLGESGSVDQPHINPMAVFGGVKRRVTSQQLESGEVMALFGGVDLDFRQARMKGTTAAVEVNAIFGGIKLRLPESWAVEVRGSAVAGGFEDKTLPPPPGPGGEPAPKLILTGNAMFGGVEIEN